MRWKTKSMAITEKFSLWGSLKEKAETLPTDKNTKKSFTKSGKWAAPSLNETKVYSKHFPPFWRSDSISTDTNSNPELASCFYHASLLSLPSFISLGRTAVKHEGKHSSSGFDCFQLPVSSQLWMILIKFGSFIKERDKEKWGRKWMSIFVFIDLNVYKSIFEACFHLSATVYNLFSYWDGLENFTYKKKYTLHLVCLWYF